MKIFFSHGKESGPGATKITRLAELALEQGCATESIDYRDLPNEPDERVERLVGLVQQEADDVLLVGSSMGGYVSLVAAGLTDARGVFLLAPALYVPGYAAQTYPYSGHVEVVHGWQDEVIPPDHSIRYAQEAQCELHMITGDHGFF